MNESHAAWDLYRSFLAILREGSLSAAARSLKLTQPTISRHLDQLEASLGTGRLFTRAPQGLTPTDAALRLAPHAEAMESAAAALQRSAAGDPSAMTGVIRIAASDVIGAEVLPGFLGEIRARHPGLVFEISLSNQMTDLLRREADIAIRMTRPNQKALVARRCPDIRLGLFAHPEYLEHHGSPSTTDELENHAIIGFDRDPSAERLLKQFGFSLDPSNFAYRIDNQIAQLSAIRQGCGIGFCQIELATRAPKLTRVLKDDVEIPLESWVTMHEDLKGDQRMRLVFDHLHAAMTSYARSDAGAEVA
ncbi:LysR family transcriptional regulator [Labrenzia sp. CE80]|uniref:LysR family transcriptional regulator n=1 Tax=Labrenzia sp. CE80 TaxID=1788986 RepID=UPI00129A77BD|nr:LysR family transcriptional regulator [Labrenzia sp. CE80]